MSIPIGRQLGSYEITALLGRGGFGEVYRAKDKKLQREVAIKVLLSDFSSDPKRLRYFEQEARSASALNHPNIVTIYDVGESEFGSYIVMELIDGTTLRNILADGPLPLKKTIHIAAQVAEGLAKAHAAGIVHRDLKPENLMIARDGVAKILDFGLAKLAEPEIENEDKGDSVTLRTEAGAILGTPGYMSPEQAGGRSVDFRSDQFSFGAILYETVTGKRAFQRDTNVETLSAIIRDEPIPVSAANPKTPAPFRWIIERCMAKETADRYASTLDLARELQSMRDHFSELAGLDAASSVASPNLGVPRRFRILATAGWAIAILAILSAFLLRTGPAPAPTFHQITFGHGLITGGRFSPDGESVIYGANWAGQGAQIFTTRPGNPESRSLGLSNAGIWSVSSSGEMAIAYPCMPSWDGCMGTLALVPSTGGAPREILDNVHDANWFPDGKTLVVAQFAGGNDRIVLYPSGNVLYETRGWVRHVRVSPKGDQIAFLDHPVLGLIGGSVCVIDFADGKNKKVLSSGWNALRSLAWSPSGDELWFTSSGFKGKGDLPNLFAVTLSGKERTILSVPMYSWIKDISRDGRHLLLLLSRPRAAMIGLVPGAAKERNFSWFDISVAADLSTDGKTILFYEYGGATNENRTIFLRKSDGSDAKRLGEGTPLALSPDGQWALALQHTVPPQLVLLPTGIGKPKPLPRGAIGEFLDWAAWSPDGSRIFFTAIEAGHRARTYVQDIDGGMAQPVTPEGMAGTLLSPDAKRVAAVDRYQQYYLCPVDGGEPSPLEGYDDGDVLLQWSTDGRTIFLRGPESEELKIYRLDLQNWTKTLWKELTPPDPAGLMAIGADPGQVRITPDGKSYVYTVWTSLGELYTVEGLR